MINLLRHSAPVTLPILFTKSPLWEPLLLSYKTLIFLTSKADLSNPTLRGESLCTRIKRLDLINCLI